MLTTLPADARRPGRACGRALAATGLLALAACTGGGTGGDRTGGRDVSITAATVSGPSSTSGSVGTLVATSPGTSPATSPATSPTASPAASPTASPAAPPATSPATPTPSPTTSTTPTPSTSCTDQLVARLTPAQRTGQLLMVGIQPGQAPGGLDATIRGQHIGGVIYLGGWQESAGVTATSAHVQGQATQAATGGVQLFVAADQEGGEVQQLKGSGFTTMPSAVSQGRSPQASIRRNGTTVGTELKRAGVNVNLAPVADTVPTEIGRGNAPIGRYSREFGSDPATVTKGVTATIEGLGAGGIASTVKHFPGLGRISGNTDTTARGITDDTATTSDPFLAPFANGIRAGAQLVMVSSARYPKLDPTNQAVFSPSIISGLLRGTMNFGGVVITDDVGVAQAVAAVAPGDRAVRFVAAGGDIVLTAAPSTVPAMTAALQAQADRDPAFARKIDASVRRVLVLKQRMGLASCG